MKLVKILALYCMTLFVGQFNLSAMSPHLSLLLDDMKEYKTTNTVFHAGHLYEHSIWVARAVINLLRSRCAQDIALNYNLIKILVVAGLLHDIGKAGDLQFVFFEKRAHPETGFLYITGNNYVKYCIKKTGGEFIFKNLFEELNFSPNEKALVAIIAGMHHDLGALMRGPNTRYCTRSETQQLCEQTLLKIDHLIQVSGYMGGTVNRKSEEYRQLICYICLISTADVCAAQVVPHEAHHNLLDDFFGIKFSQEANRPGIGLQCGLNAYARFEYKQIGPEVKRFLIQCASS
jgi:hypothetical protein